MSHSVQAPIGTEAARSSAIDRVLWIILVLSFIFSLCTSTIGFHNSLFDFHGFRQTQTAITAEYLVKGGSFLHYETPVLGPPWSIPFEFPLYQGVVAIMVRLFSWPIDQTGRSVSLLFYYLCFLPLASILGRLGYRGTRMIPVLVLFAVSPLYIFISRLFMIESMALFFSLMYVEQVFRLVLGANCWQHRHVACATVFGVLAALVKVTTLAPFFALAASLIAWTFWRDYRAGKPASSVTMLSVSVSCVASPLAAASVWTRFADGVKDRNPLGAHLTSSALRTWNFGTLAQRLHPRTYGHFLLVTNNHIGSFAVAFLVLAVYLWLCRKWNWVAIACVVFYCGTIAVFFNLHYVHEYYPYANAIFLIAAVGVLIASLLDVPGPRAWIGVVLLVAQITACAQRYFSHYYPIQSKNYTGHPNTAALIERTTAPGSVILITGLDWTSELAYQSHRRAIMDGFFSNPNMPLGPIEQVIANQGAHNIAAVVACFAGRYDSRLPLLLKDVDISNSTNQHEDDCDIYERGPEKVIHN